MVLVVFETFFVVGVSSLLEFLRIFYEIKFVFYGVAKRPEVVFLLLKILLSGLMVLEDDFGPA